MATAVIIDDYRKIVSIPTTIDHPVSSIKDLSPGVNTKIIDRSGVKEIIPISINYPIASISYSAPLSAIQEILPFRVRFTTIIIEGPSSSSPPGIGLQIIGYSNWII